MNQLLRCDVTQPKMSWAEMGRCVCFQQSSLSGIFHRDAFETVFPPKPAAVTVQITVRERRAAIQMVAQTLGDSSFRSGGSTYMDDSTSAVKDNIYTELPGRI